MRSVSIALCALLAAASAAAAPISIVHQGRLLHGDDTVVNEALTLKFSFYRLETDPSVDPPAPVWSRTYAAVNVMQGLYAVALGGAGTGGVTLDSQLFVDAGGPLYLQVTVGDVALAPRLRVGTVPLAVFADEAGNAQKLGGRTTEDLKQVFSTKEAVDALKAPGNINTGTNPVDWTQLKNVPTTIVSGVASVSVGPSLSGLGSASAPLSVVYGTTDGTAAAGNDARFGQITVLQQQLDTLSTSLTGYVKQDALTATLGGYVKPDALATTLGGYVKQDALTTTLGGYAKQDASGGLRVASDASVCNATSAGLIRFVNGNFQGCTGTTWANLNNAPPSIASISPVGGTASGGTTVTIFGAGFTAPSLVSIGGVPCTSVTVLSATQLTAVTPAAGTLGPRDVRVENSDSLAATKVGGYAYTQLTFAYTGLPQQFVVPSGVTSINVDLSGAAGARSPVNATSGSPGGNGGRVQATLVVVPGETLLVYVGGQGVGRNAGGFNGAGDGGKQVSYNPGAQGGGASDLRRSVNLVDRIVVAGGGGGGGYDSNPATGGAGGGLTGGDGDIHTYVSSVGRGGTQNSGGAGGTYPGYTTSPPGGLWQGGSALSANLSSDSSGGGGGGGYFGGGAGCWGGGGGGSSYTISTATSVTHTQGYRAGDGQVVIALP